MRQKWTHVMKKYAIFFDKVENTSQAAESVNSVYCPDTVTANHTQFWFRLFRSINIDVQDASQLSTSITKNNENRRV